MSWETLPIVGQVSTDQPGDAQSVWKGEGWSPRRSRRADNPQYQRDLTEAIRLVEKVVEGDRWAGLRFQEAMSTSDFPQLFTDILDRQVLAKFREWPSRWTPIAKERTTRDFRNAKLYLPNTGATGELASVGELTEYPEASVAEQAPQTYSVTKFGRTLGISWETLINDDLDMFRDLPQRLALAARRTEDYTATRLYVDAAGPHASLYTVGNKNIVNTTNSGAAPSGVTGWDDNPPLSVGALHQAMVVLANMTDEDGEPIYMEMVTLVVPPALEVPAMNMLNAVELSIGVEGQGKNEDAIQGATTMRVQNWLQRKVTLLVNPYIPYVATSNDNTSWFLFGDPNDPTSREALSMVFLRGYREPQLFMKAPNAQSMSGNAGEYSGDFESDATWYKIRHVMGSLRTSGGFRTTVASNGSGS